MVFCCQRWIVEDETEYGRDDDISPAPSAIQMTPPAQQQIYGSWLDDRAHLANVLRSLHAFRVFTRADLDEATQNFDQSSKIGEGQFGSIHLGVVKSLEPPFDDIKVAVKRAKIEKKGGDRTCRLELLLHEKIKHQNLVKIIGYCNEDNGKERNWFLVYEYMANGSLDSHLPSLSWGRRLLIAKEAATGLAYLHDKMIVFRDFNPSKILLDSQMSAKLSDFGNARVEPRDGSTHVSTLVVGIKSYAAPEFVLTGHLSTKIDVWSYGIFLEELITGGFPLAQETQEKNPECLSWVCCNAGEGKTNLIADPLLEGKYCEKSMQKLASLANKCLVKQPELRPKMSDVLKMVTEAIELEMLNQKLPSVGQT